MKLPEELKKFEYPAMRTGDLTEAIVRDCAKVAHDHPAAEKARLCLEISQTILTRYGLEEKK